MCKITKTHIILAQNFKENNAEFEKKLQVFLYSFYHFNKQNRKNSQYFSSKFGEKNAEFK
jgi:hypothetical protein